MIYLAFLVGVILGTIITKALVHHRTGYGYFKVEPYKDEEGFYTVNVRIPNEQNLLNIDKIILKRERTQH